MNVESDTYIYPFIDALKKIQKADEMGNQKDLKWHFKCAKRFATQSKTFKNYAGKPNANNDTEFITQSIIVLEKINSIHKQKQHLITESQRDFELLISNLNKIK